MPKYTIPGWHVAISLSLSYHQHGVYWNQYVLCQSNQYHSKYITCTSFTLWIFIIMVYNIHSHSWGNVPCATHIIGCFIIWHLLTDHGQIVCYRKKSLVLFNVMALSVLYYIYDIRPVLFRFGLCTTWKYMYMKDNRTNGMCGGKSYFW